MRHTPACTSGPFAITRIRLTIARIRLLSLAACAAALAGLAAAGAVAAQTRGDANHSGEAQTRQNASVAAEEQHSASADAQEQHSGATQTLQSPALRQQNSGESVDGQNAQQAQPGAQAVPEIHVTSALVFLDVTVLDKKGRPVVSGLTKDDFTITEDKKPEPIFSFEAPDVHVLGPNASDENPDGKAPVTILVLDFLNSSFEDGAYIRHEARQFLMKQPEQLPSLTELLVMGNESLEMLQGYTRSRAELLYALNHLPVALPYKRMNEIFFMERFGQSMDALQEIALQNKGVPGRKNIVWVGHGGPNLYLDPLDFPGKLGDEMKQYVHDTTNMLVKARVSLFVLYPGLPVTGRTVWFSAMQADADIGETDPFAGDINFGVLTRETGGKLFYNRNDVDREIEESEQMGGEYYTLTYQPQNGDPNGKFRRIRVTLRDKNLRAVTKAGYFAPDKNAPVSRRQKSMADLAEAVQSTIPFRALSVSVAGLVRHPDSGTAEFTVQLKSRNLTFSDTSDGKSAAKLMVAAASVDKYGTILASRVEGMTLVAHDADPKESPDLATSFQFTIRLPRKTQSVRVVMMEDQTGGRIGAADFDHKTLAAAPEAPTPPAQPAEPAPADSRPGAM